MFWVMCGSFLFFTSGMWWVYFNVKIIYNYLHYKQWDKETDNSFVPFLFVNKGFVCLFFMGKWSDVQAFFLNVSK